MDTDFNSFVGNGNIKAFFSNCIRHSSFSHAYIFAGESGIGKHTFANLFCAAVNCEVSGTDRALPCGACPSCKKILEKNSPDITYISKEDKATIGVDAIRFIKSDICIAPNDGDYKIYIIEDAQLMTRQAQNALLLSLEEPPEYVIFILLCTDTEPLLETIKSRAPTIRFTSPEKCEATEYLKNNVPAARMMINNAPLEFEQLYKASSGRIGRLIDLIGGEKKQILLNRELISSLIDSLSSPAFSSEIPSFLSKFSAKRDEISEQLSEFQRAVRDLLAIKKSDTNALVFYTDQETAENTAYVFSVKKLLSMLEKAESTRLAILMNANIKLTLTDFLIGLI